MTRGFTQASGSFVGKYIFGRANLQAGCFRDKGKGIPEYVALRFLASLRKGVNETNVEWCTSCPNSIHLSRSLSFPVHSNITNICSNVVRQQTNKHEVCDRISV